MNRIISIMIIGFLVSSGIVAVAHTSEDNSKIQNIITLGTTTMEFSQLSITNINNEKVEINLEEATSFLMTPNKPILPKVTHRFELPFGVKDVKVTVTLKDEIKTRISGYIRPAPMHIPLVSVKNSDQVVTAEKDETVYASSEPYPNSDFSCKVSCGLNHNMERVTHVTIHIYPIKYTPASGEISSASRCNVEVTYTPPEPIIKSKNVGEYDLVIIAPKKFSSELNRLKEHKDSFGMKTFLKTTEEIYEQFSGRDKPEQIKYFIMDAIEEHDIKYVLLVGGLKSLIWANPREHENYGAKHWYVPVRYNNLFDNPEHPLSAEKIHDPGVITDLYYADIYGEGAEFQDWDTNNDGIIAAWGRHEDGIENDTGIDMEPDVALGRLACRNKRELKNVVDKIIQYESKPALSSWFNRIVSITGDGFLDQEDLDFQWDTDGLPDGKYYIKAQSWINDPTAGDIAGPIDIIPVTIDKDTDSSITVNHNDNLNPALADGYPAPPIVEITVPSPGDILGYSDVEFEPGEGEVYCNTFSGWSNVEYTGGVMHIRGKSYDPRPYGVVTDVHLWIENNYGDVVFNDWRYDTEMYYEGEWVAGNELLNGGGGAFYYMDDEAYDEVYIWASNGKLDGEPTVLDALNPGCGFAFFSGHGSPNTWGDHYPGVPGNRGSGSVDGLRVFGIRIFPPFFNYPLLPMTHIKNYDKLPVVLIGGCHNSQFNVTMLYGVLDILFINQNHGNRKNTWKHGSLVPECFSWFLVRMKEQGAIATIGNTGLGYGILGKDCTIGGLDGGICIEFFKQYGANNHHILGDAYSQTLVEYVNTFDMEEDDHIKSLQQWLLLGDPSLMIGGYD